MMKIKRAKYFCAAFLPLVALAITEASINTDLMQNTPVDVLAKIAFAYDENKIDTYKECLLGKKENIDLALKEFEMAQSAYAFIDKLNLRFGNDAWSLFNKQDTMPSISMPNLPSKNSQWLKKAKLKSKNDNSAEYISGELGKVLWLSRSNNKWFYNLDLTFGNREINYADINKMQSTMKETFQFGIRQLNENKNITLTELKQSMGQYFWNH